MISLEVNASKNYKVIIAKDFSFFSEVLPFFKGEKVAVITDANVNRLYPDFFKDKINKKLFVYEIPAGENSKSIGEYAKLMNSLAKDGFTRNDTVVTFGGGVVGDLGAFIASTYMRGIGLVAVPTTLLSMVDSSVGGKTAINLDCGKNLCGTFYQPDAVYIPLDFLKTLDDREKESGMGEIAKYAFISPDVKFDLSDGITEQTIYECLKIKAEIVSQDEKEGGLRKLLNFGHTFGHAIEKESGFTLSHGICVAKGIRLAIRVSEKYYGLREDVCNSLLDKLDGFGLDTSCDYNIEELLYHVFSDKKRSEGKVDFVMIGKDLYPHIERIKIERLKDLLQ